jgi:hypothetical protein
VPKRFMTKPINLKWSENLALWCYNTNTKELDIFRPRPTIEKVMDFVGRNIFVHSRTNTSRKYYS